MKNIGMVLLAICLSLARAQPSAAAGKSWESDSAHSNFYFSIDHIYSKIRGHFNQYTGKIQFDPEKAGESSFAFKIQTESIDTNIAKRDKHLQSADFFDAATYPAMTFESFPTLPVAPEVRPSSPPIVGLSVRPLVRAVEPCRVEVLPE